MKICAWQLVFLIAASIPQARAQTLFATSCAEDSEIEATKRQAVDNSATKFLQTLFSANPTAAFDALSTEGRKSAKREDFPGLANAIIRKFFTDEHNAVLSRLKDTRVQKTYLLNLKGKSPGNIVCGRSLSSPDGWASLAASDIPEQAYVLITAPATNNEITFTLWLVPEQSQSKIQSIWTNVSTLADKGALQVWQLARAQSAQGHQFNAALLLSAAADLALRGPNFQAGITQSISKDMSTLTLPAEISGPPPFTWKSPDHTWKVLNAGPLAIGGKIYVLLIHEVQPWQTDAQVDGWNKQLLVYFKKRFPEYSGAFAGLVARARERGTNRGFGTVEELGSPK